MSRRRKKGPFDPDYRRKEWRDTAFAPKNSTLDISQLSLIFALLVTAAVYVQFEDHLASNLIGTGGIILGAVTLFTWIAVALALLRITRRRIPKQQFDINDELIDHEAPATYQEFEHEVAHLLNTLTRYKAVVVGGANDGGVDINLFAGSNLVGIVQCKLYDPKRALSPAFIRELYACKMQAGVRNAILVTTTYFSKSAEQEARKMGIKLIDGDKLDQMREQARNRQTAKV